MNYSIEKKTTYAVLKITKEKLDSQVSPSVKSEIAVLSAEGFKNIIFDLENVRFCDSSGLSSILVANRLCKNAGGKLVICNVQDMVKKLISISQLDSVLNTTANIAEAESRF
jgi:anti-sigma B factor antagonist